MFDHSLRRAFALSVIGLSLCVGCDAGAQGPTITAEEKLHQTKSQFSADDLNAPLGKSARAKGAQVAAPPVR